MLADLSLETCLLPATTDSLNACLLGSWTSACTFRRPCFCAFSKAFALSPLGEPDPEAPKILKLPRAVAQEFQLAAALAPVACSDVAAPFADRLYATDASEAKGACVSAPLPIGKEPMLVSARLPRPCCDGPTLCSRRAPRLTNQVQRGPLLSSLTSWLWASRG